MICVFILVEWWFYAMASSHRSSPVPQGSSSDVFFKKEVDPAKHIRPVQSLPDVCPKEPTGNFSDDLCYHLVLSCFMYLTSNFIMLKPKLYSRLEN